MTKKDQKCIFKSDRLIYIFYFRALENFAS